MSEFKFKNVQSDKDRLSDMIVSAMETGNAGRARTIAGEHEGTFPKEIAEIRSEVLIDYGVRI